MKLQISGMVLVALLACSSAVANEAADKIYQATGVQGGLVVHIGLDDGKLTAALGADESFLVQGLYRDSKSVEKARTHIRSLGLDGTVSADVFDGEHLPYVDNLVNLVVVSGSRFQVSGEEIERVLCPGGVALEVDPETRTLKPETLFRKPWPADIDEWNHYLHGPDNNAVASDSVVGPPRHFQWISPPRFSRSHDHLASVTAVVSSGGRLFYIVDRGSIAFAGAGPRWRLVARDAFNGIKLWDREISSWEYHLRDFRAGPADIARRLVAVGDRVYVTPGYGQPVVALNAATGETLRTYTGSEETREILHFDGKLLLVLGNPKKNWRARHAKEIVSQTGYRPPFENVTPPAHEMRVMAVDAETGDLLWKNAEPYTRDLLPSTLAADAGRVYFQNVDAVVCLDATSGQLKWQAPRPAHRRRLAWSTPTLVVHDGVVYSADRRAADTKSELLWIPSGGYHEYIRGEDVQGELIALSAETGERLWSCPAYEGFNSPVDVMIADGLLWTGRYAWGGDPGVTEARDPKTGEVRRQRPSDMEFLPRIGHARCHRARATSNFLVLGRRGVEFVDLETGGMVANFWVRGICQYGVMPANGLLYLPPHSCACSTNDMLKCGFMALAPARESRAESGERRAGGERLEKGPAYAEVISDQLSVINGQGGEAHDIGRRSPITDHRSLITDHRSLITDHRSLITCDWPTYRGDNARGGATASDIPADLKQAWKTEIGGRLSALTVAGNKVFLASVDTHTVYALDAESGEQAWSYTVGGRVDSPPTIDQGRVLFGSADGRVYCLRLNDGQLIWKYRAAPRDRRMVANGQLESPWPVSGSVLVIDGNVFFAAGRTSYLDGGMLLYKLDAATGNELDVAKLIVDEKRRNGGFASGGNLPDVLSADDESIFLLAARFDRDLVRQKDNVPHLWSSVGFLDDSWWHRTYWQFGTSMSSGWGGWAKAGQKVPAGRLLVTDGSRIFGFGRNQYDTPGSHVGVDADGVWGPIGREKGRWTSYQLFGRTMAAGDDQSNWKRRILVLGRAMILAGDTLFVAGPSHEVNDAPQQPAGADPLVEALESRRDGRLLAVSTADGKTLAELELSSPPVFDGMAAAQGRLYLSTMNGEVVCLSAPH